MTSLELANAIGTLVFCVIATAGLAGLIVTLTVYFMRKFKNLMALSENWRKSRNLLKVPGVEDQIG